MFTFETVLVLSREEIFVDLWVRARTFAAGQSNEIGR